MMHRTPPNLHQEASVVGWISSTDVMLLTVVMLMGVSVAASNQWQKAKEKAENTENDLRQTQAELKNANQLSAELRQTVISVSSDPDLTSLQARLDAAKKHAADAALKATAAEEALKEVQRALRAEQEAAVELATILKAEQNTVARLTSEQEQLKEQLAAQELDVLRIAGEAERLQTELDKMTARNMRGSAAYKALKVREAELAAKIAELDEAKAALEKRANIAEEELSLRNNKVRSLENQTAQLRDELENLRGRLVTNQSIKRRLVGLEGQLKKVAIVFDASGSMTTGGRWNLARSVVTTWIEDLEMDECVLIVFNSDVREFPGEGKLLPVSGEAGADNRKKLSDFLAKVKPEGGTRTRAALEAAYRYKGIDTIVLFTDGAPNDGIARGKDGLLYNDPKEVEAIYKLCEQHPAPPINTVGLGNYFDIELSKFLQQVAQKTGGTFLGR